jgi:hypothetical protein
MWHGIGLFILLSSPPFLELLMQARGYGILALCALLHCTLVLQFVKQPSNRTLALISAVAFVGTWTVPSYIFFAGPLHAFLFLQRRDRATFVAGAITALLIGIAYSPVATALLQASNGYRAEHGAQFPTFLSLGILATDYLRIQTGWYQIVLSLLPVATILWLKVSKEENFFAYRILFATCCFSIWIIVVLQTPLARTVAYVLIPLFFISGAGAQALWNRFPPHVHKAGDFAVLLVASTLAIFRVLEPPYVPIENWGTVAHVLNDTFPENVSLYAPFRYHQLAPYLSSQFERTAAFDEALFRSGKLIAVENGYAKAPFPAIPTQTPGIRSLAIPQQRGGKQVIYWVEMKTPEEQ